MCTKLGSISVDDVTIFTENDSNFCVDITSTKDGKFITVNSNSRTSSEEGTYPLQFSSFMVLTWKYLALVSLTPVVATLQVYFINSMDPETGLQRFCRRVSGVQYFLEHHYGFFYILTNAPMRDDKKFSGNGYYLARCRVEDVQSANFQVILCLNVYLESRKYCLYVLILSMTLYTYLEQYLFDLSL